jgi:hypothetical protein
MGGIAKKQKRNGSNDRFVSYATLALSNNNIGDMTGFTAQTTLQNIPARVVVLDHRTKEKMRVQNVMFLLSDIGTLLS